MTTAPRGTFFSIKTEADKRKVMLLSPVFIILVNHAVALLGGKAWGAWAYVPVMLSNWILFLFFISIGADGSKIKSWLRKPKGSVGWAVLALSMGLLPLPIFLMGWKLLAPWLMWVPWLLIALINPWLEELYWRGVLLDTVRGRWGILYSSLLFAANHPLSYGVNSIRNNGWTIAIVTFIMGLVWALVYKKTNSLRWPIAGHLLVDILSLSTVVFLNKI